MIPTARASDRGADGPPPSHRLGEAPESAPARKHGVENLNVGLVTVIGFVVTIVSTAATFGAAWNRLSVLENRADQDDRIRAERIAQLERLQLDVGLMRADIQALREGRAADAQQLRAIDDKLGKIGDLVIAICQAERGKGFTCTVR